MDNAHYGLEIFSKTVNNIVMEGGGGGGKGCLFTHIRKKKAEAFRFRCQYFASYVSNLRRREKTIPDFYSLSSYIV